MAMGQTVVFAIMEHLKTKGKGERGERPNFGRKVEINRALLRISRQN